MAKVVLIHSALGLRPGVETSAARLREAGHEVWTPDLFEGRAFEQLEEGIAHREEVGGAEELMRRADAALTELPPDVVYAGFAMGAASAGYCAATRPGCRGAILIHGVAPLSELGVEAWPKPVPAQVHLGAEDPYIDPAGVQQFEFALDAVCARLEIHFYPGTAHLFADPDAADYEPAAAELMLGRILGFLERYG